MTTRISVALVISALSVAAVTSQTSPAGGARSSIRLVDVAAQAGLTVMNVHGAPTRDYIIDTIGNGVACFDYDNDRDLDVLLVNGSTRERMAAGGNPMAALYRNDGDGHFTDVTAATGLNRRGWGTGVCVADYDNDGFQDVYITAFGPNVLLPQQRRGHSRIDVRRRRRGPAMEHGLRVRRLRSRRRRRSVCRELRDVRSEARCRSRGRGLNCRYSRCRVCGPRGLAGRARRLYRNRGNGTFTDVTQPAGMTEPGYYGFGVLFSDLDDDGWPDIYVANDSTPNLFFRNQRDGTFVERGCRPASP